MTLNSSNSSTWNKSQTSKSFQKAQAEDMLLEWKRKKIAEAQKNSTNLEAQGIGFTANAKDARRANEIETLQKEKDIDYMKKKYPWIK